MSSDLKGLIISIKYTLISRSFVKTNHYGVVHLKNKKKYIKLSTFLGFCCSYYKITMIYKSGFNRLT